MPERRNLHAGLVCTSCCVRTRGLLTKVLRVAVCPALRVQTLEPHTPNVCPRGLCEPLLQHSDRAGWLAPVQTRTRQKSRSIDNGVRRGPCPRSAPRTGLRWWPCLWVACVCGLKFQFHLLFFLEQCGDMNKCFRRRKKKSRQPTQRQVQSWQPPFWEQAPLQS